MNVPSSEKMFKEFAHNALATPRAGHVDGEVSHGRMSIGRGDRMSDRTHGL